MKYAICYSSKTGNTKMLAEAIENRMNRLAKKHKTNGTRSYECIYIGEPSRDALEADVIFLGFWTDRGKCDEVAEEFLPQIRKTKIILFGTCGFGGSHQYYQQILGNVADEMDATAEIIGSFMCQGKMPQSVGDRYEAMLAKEPENQQAKLMLKNYESAKTHPDKADLDLLKKVVAKLFA